MDIETLHTKVVEAIFTVGHELCPGYLEVVYRNALLYELRLRGIKCEAEVPIPVKYKGVTVGEYRCDILVDDSLIMELKATESLTKNNEIQLVNYLVATGIDQGLLVNFGTTPPTIKRKRRIFTRT